MYEIFRTAFDGNKNPMRLTVTVYPADRNQFVTNVGQVPEPVSGLARAQKMSAKPAQVKT